MTMRARLSTHAATLAALATVATAGAAEPGPEPIRAAVRKAIGPIQKSMAEYPGHRDCFSCHHQGVPTVALALAKQRGYEVDDAVIRRQVELTEDDLARAAD